MDYMPETIRSLSLQYQKERTRFPIDHVRLYMYQCLKALEYVHSKRICHRDLKPDNLLVDPSRQRLKVIDFGCAKVLVKGQPNVSYICSRYYRAPELMFGATEYTTAVDMWSVGTILVELLLGHLPFQGQDSTQQHLVEIMKLLGTPTEKELRSMRANCSAEDLPKLKAYPWDKVFPQGTPPRAMDLAYKLLAYDPSLRLTATQALQHPFLQGVEYILDSNGGPPREGEASRAWQQQVAQQLQAHFSHYAAARNGAVLGLLPQLEGTLKPLLLTSAAAEGGIDRVMPAVLAEVKAVLERCERAELDAFAELQRKVMCASNGSADVGAHDRAGAAQAAAEAQAAVTESAATIERMQRQAAEAREEAAAMREQLEALQAQLAGAQGGYAVEVPGAEPVPLAVPTSGRRALAAQQGTSQGMASPMAGRTAMVDGGDHSDTSGRQPRSRLHMNSLAEDEMGQVTPLGAANGRDNAREALVSLPGHEEG